jgi:hypothetical protein
VYSEIVCSPPSEVLANCHCSQGLHTYIHTYIHTYAAADCDDAAVADINDDANDTYWVMMVTFAGKNEAGDATPMLAEEHRTAEIATDFIAREILEHHPQFNFNNKQLSFRHNNKNLNNSNTTTTTINNNLNNTTTNNNIDLLQTTTITKTSETATTRPKKQGQRRDSNISGSSSNSRVGDKNFTARGVRCANDQPAVSRSTHTLVSDGSSRSRGHSNHTVHASPRRAAAESHGGPFGTTPRPLSPSPTDGSMSCEELMATNRKLARRNADLERMLELCIERIGQMENKLPHEHHASMSSVAYGMESDEALADALLDNNESMHQRNRHRSSPSQRVQQGLGYSYSDYIDSMDDTHWGESIDRDLPVPNDTSPSHSSLNDPMLYEHFGSSPVGLNKVKRGGGHHRNPPFEALRPDYHIIASTSPSLEHRHHHHAGPQHSSIDQRAHSHSHSRSQQQRTHREEEDDEEEEERVMSRGGGDGDGGGAAGSWKNVKSFEEFCSELSGLQDEDGSRQ